MYQIINELILDLKKKLGVTSIVITHDMKSAFAISDTMAMLYDGRAELVAAAAEFKETKNPYARQFMEGSSQGPIQMAITN